MRGTGMNRYVKSVIMLGLAALCMLSSSGRCFAKESKEVGTLQEFRWKKTDERYLEPTIETRQEDPFEISAQHGQNPEAFVFSFDVVKKANYSRFPFHNCKGETVAFNINCSDFADSYKAGETCAPTLKWYWIHFDSNHTPGEVFGAFYFADIEENGNDPFGQKVTVRQYFTKGGLEPDDTYEMQYFGRNTYGRDRIGNKDSLETEYIFCPTAKFPQGRKEGEKLYIVYETEDGFSGETKMRNIYEFTWTQKSDAYYEQVAKEKALENRPRPNPLYEEDMP